MSVLYIHTNSMNFCVVPDKELFLKIDERMETFMTKLTVFTERSGVKTPSDNKERKFQGGVMIMIPVIIGIVINMFGVSDFDNMKKFRGIKVLRREDVKVFQYRRGIDDINEMQLYESFNNKYNDKQLQVYNSFPQPKQNQIDIQRCLYHITLMYVNKKYGRSERNTRYIKSVIFSIFSNHLFFLALVSFFINNDESSRAKKNAKIALNATVEDVILYENVYKSISPSGKNEHITKLKMLRSSLPQLGQTGEKMLRSKTQKSFRSRKDLFPDTVKVRGDNDIDAIDEIPESIINMDPIRGGTRRRRVHCFRF